MRLRTEKPRIVGKSARSSLLRRVRNLSPQWDSICFSTIWDPRSQYKCSKSEFTLIAALIWTDFILLFKPVTHFLKSAVEVNMSDIIKIYIVPKLRHFREIRQCGPIGKISPFMRKFSQRKTSQHVRNSKSLQVRQKASFLPSDSERSEQREESVGNEILRRLWLLRMTEVWPTASHVMLSVSEASGAA